MSGILLSCCNVGQHGGRFFLAYCDDSTNAISWIRLDDVDVDLGRASGATGLFYEQGSCFVAIQGIHDPAIVLEFDYDFRFKRSIPLPGVRDIHSIKVYDGHLYAASTGTNELIEVDLRNLAEFSCAFRSPTTPSIPNVHLNDYLRHNGKEYVLGHSNPFSAAGRRNGFVYCLSDREVVLDKLEHAHTLLDVNGELGVLDSARGRIVVAENGHPKPWLQIDTGGILRGACQTDDSLLAAMSSRRLFSRKQGLLQINVPQDQVVLGDEAFMSWLYRYDKSDLKSYTRISLSEIAFEIYDLIKVSQPPAPDRLLPHAAALRAQASRQQYFWLSRRSVGSEEDQAPSPPEPVAAKAAKEESVAVAKDESLSLWVLPTADETSLLADKERPSRRPAVKSAASPPTPAPTDENFQIVRAEGSTKTVIAFAGLAQLIGGMTTFNFMNSLKGVNANVIFVRDPARTWYNGPIEGIGRNSREIARKLGELVSSLSTKQLYLLGASSGGFAALAYAKELKATRVLAFSPQTSISVDYLNSVGELRWIKLISRIKSPSIVDASPLIAEATRLECHLIVGSRMQLDTVYAERLRANRNIHFHYVNSGHNPAQYLRKRDKLSIVLEKFIMDKPLTVGSNTPLLDA